MSDEEKSMSNDERAVAKARQLLPAWFTGRMMEDLWCFGLLMSDGTLICIDRILEVHEAVNGSLWLDVQLSETIPSGAEKYAKLFKSPTSRTEASINVAQIMAAFETADT